MKPVLWYAAACCVLAPASPAASQARIEKNVVIGMVSGLALVMDVHHPQVPNGYAVVHISGSGWGRSLAYDAEPLSERQIDVYGPPLVDAGYTVFSLNHRAIPRFQWPDPLHDAQRAVRYIRAHAAEYGIDPERIGAIGGSSGGALALSLGVRDGVGKSNDRDLVSRQSARVQAVVARAPGGVDMNNSTDETIALLMGSWSDPSDPESEEYRRRYEASPLNHVSTDDSPTLLLHGDQDAGVRLERSERMRDELRSVGVESELLVIPGAGHGPHVPWRRRPTGLSRGNGPVVRQTLEAVKSGTT